MARPRGPILHLPGTYSGAIFIDFLKRVTSFICGPRHLYEYNWRALPRSHRKRITSLTQPGPRRPRILLGLRGGAARRHDPEQRRDTTTALTMANQLWF